MRTVDAIRYFGSQQKLATALGIRQPSVATWGELVPPLRQVQIEHITGGALKAQPGIYAPKPRPKGSGEDGDGGRLDQD